MPLSHKPFGTLKESDLLALIEKKIPEAKRVDFKRAVPPSIPEAHLEFSSDVSSFANSAGGFLVFGMTEKGGIAQSLPGLDVENREREILRLEEMARSGIRPRITGINTRAIPLESGKCAIVMMIPRSWAAPHMVIVGEYNKFFSRNSSGKHLMDVGEIRNAVLLSETIAKRIRDFRLERCAALIENHGPISLEGEAKLVLHVIPFSAFDAGVHHEVGKLKDSPGAGVLKPMQTSGWDWRFNIDGLLAYTADAGENGPVGDTYVQVFNNGIVEYVETGMLAPRGKERTIPSKAYETECIDAAGRAFRIYEMLGINPPIAILLSLLSVRGMQMYLDPMRFGRNEHAIDRDHVFVPDVVAESLSGVSKLMKPAFDAVWNACGLPRSLNYDASGNRMA